MERGRPCRQIRHSRMKGLARVLQKMLKLWNRPVFIGFTGFQKVTERHGFRIITNSGTSQLLQLGNFLQKLLKPWNTIEYAQILWGFRLCRSICGKALPFRAVAHQRCGYAAVHNAKPQAVKPFIFNAGNRSVLHKLLKPWNKLGRSIGELFSPIRLSSVLFLILAISSITSAQEKPGPILTDEFGKIGCEDLLARADNFGNELQSKPSFSGVAVIFGAKGDSARADYTAEFIHRAIIGRWE
jgi:hypothetical protein